MNASITLTPEPTQVADDLVAASTKLVRQLKLGTGVALAMLALLATSVPITSGVVQSGRIMTEGRRKVVEHPIGGSIEDLRVADGAKVHKGQVLLRLDAGDALLNVQVLEAQAASLQAEQAARQAELMNALDVQYPASLLSRENDPVVASAMNAQRVAFHARRAMVKAQQAQAEKRLVELESGTAGTRARALASATQIHLLDDELAGMRKLYAKGFASKSRLNTLERTAAEQRGQFAALEADGGKLTAQQAETRIQRRQVKQEAEAAAADALQGIERDLAEVMQKLAAGKRALSQTLVRAPTSGTVIALAKSAGEYVQSGEPLLEIVPADDRLIVRAQVLPAHADEIRVGQSALVRFDAAGGRGTATLKGHVQNISADAITNPHNGETYFEATIAIPRSEAAKAPPQLLKPGMPAEVLMRAGERTALDYMLSPLTRSIFHMMREA